MSKSVQDVDTLLSAHKRLRNPQMLSSGELAEELLAAYKWDKQLWELLLHEAESFDENVRKKLTRNVRANRGYLELVMAVLAERGRDAKDAVSSVFRCGDLEFKLRISSIAVTLCPKAVEMEFEKLLSSGASSLDDNVVTMLRLALEEARQR